MLLAIDVGNSNIVFGLMKGETLVGSFRQVTDYDRTAEEIGRELREGLKTLGVEPEEITGTIIASVVPPVMDALCAAAGQVTGRPPLVVDRDVDPGLPYEAEERLGADRAVCCVAASQKYGAPLIILDFGTATTVDAVAPDGSYLGGCILAGIRTSVNALFRNTAMLPQIDLAYPPHGSGPGRGDPHSGGSRGGGGWLGRVPDPQDQGGDGLRRPHSGDRHRRPGPAGGPARGLYRRCGPRPDPGRPANDLPAVSGNRKIRKPPVPIHTEREVFAPTLGSPPGRAVREAD